MYEVIKRPIVTEKSAILSEDFKTYVFEVDRRATKTQIKDRVERAFEVKVHSVRTMLCRSRWLKKQAKFGPPKYYKKALVRLKKGQSIAMFEGA